MEDLTLTAVLPGGLMYRANLPPGIPPEMLCDRSRQIGIASDAKALRSITPAELELLLESLRNTLSRVCYHYGRLNQLLDAIWERQKVVPGEIFWDSIVKYLHFELQAMFGAIRLIMDELIFLVARKNGINKGRIGKSPWKAHDMISATPVAPQLSSIQEVKTLRRFQSWYKTLNSYRNAFYHHGWIHGLGYGYSAIDNSKFQVSRKNALLMPDQNSIKSNSKPSEWTWNEGKQIDEVASQVFDGLDRLLKELLTDCWDISIPPEGKVPEGEHPNMIVSLTMPALLGIGKQYVIPVFSDQQKAVSCIHFRNRDNVELAAIRTISSGQGLPSILLGLQGIETMDGYDPTYDLVVAVDPVFEERNPVSFNASGINIYPISDFVKTGTIHPLTVSSGEFGKEVFIWRIPNERSL